MNLSNAPRILLFCFLLCGSSCNRDERQQDCTGVSCTEMFAMVTVKLVDRSGMAPVDEVYTLRVSTGERIGTGNQTEEDTYTVLDDGYREKLTNQQDTFRFIAARKGIKVVEQTYVLSADCCHIHKIKGPEEIRL